MLPNACIILASYQLNFFLKYVICIYEAGSIHKYSLNYSTKWKNDCKGVTTRLGQGMLVNENDGPWKGSFHYREAETNVKLKVNELDK